MKQLFLYLSIAFITFTFGLQGCKDSGNEPEPTPTATKSVSVGAQSGALTEKQAGTVNYPVTTSNIANGSYSATVANLPAGVTVSGNVSITGNSGTLSLAGSTSTVAGTTTNLTLSIDGATSQAFSLTIAAAPAAPVITIATQPAAATSVTAGAVTGSLTVAATVTGGATLSYQWYSNTANNNTGGTAISGATSASFTIPTTLTAGAYYYFCEVRATGAASVRSNVSTVTVSAPTPSTPFEVNITGTISHTTHTVGQSGTVSFSRFPATVDEWKQAREKIGGQPHGAVALQLMASEMWRRNNTTGRSCIDLNNVTSNITSCVNRLNDVFSPSSARPYQMAAYLKGASWQNGYNPTKPYTIEMRVAAGRPYTNSSTHQATVIYIEVISHGHDSGSVPVAVLKTQRPGEPGENGKFFIVFECSSLYNRCREISFTNPFNGLD